MPKLGEGCAVVNPLVLFLTRNFPVAVFQSILPATALMASIFWMLVTWCLWFLPDILWPMEPSQMPSNL